MASRSFGPDKIRVWVVIMTAVGGIVFGAGGMSTAFRKDIGVLQTRHQELTAAQETLEIQVHQLDKTQAQMLVKLEHIDEKLGQLVELLERERP